MDEVGDEGQDDDPVEAARQEVIDAFGRCAEVYGLNHSYGRLYGILFFADGPLSLDALVAESGYAKSTVSTATQRMDRLHLVHRRSVPGEGKKAFYEAERDFWRIVQEFLRSEVRREIRVMTRALDAAEERLADAEGDRAASDLEKIRSLQRTYDRSERLVALLTGASMERLADLADRLRRSE